MSFFFSDGGFGPVSGINNRFIGQKEKLGPNAIDEQIEVAAGEVGPADASVEKHVAYDCHIFFFVVENQTTR